MTLNGTELALIDHWQRNFPLATRPFAVVGRSVGIDENATLSIFDRLRKQEIISRIGAVVRPHTLGTSTLAAMRVPPARLEEVAAVVTRQPLVSHNYERTNDVNLWFVVAGPDAAAVAATLQGIEALTGIEVLDLPLQQAYHLDLGFPLGGGTRRQVETTRISSDYRPDPLDRKLLAAIEDGLPIVEQPYGVVAATIGLNQEHVIARLAQLSERGVVTRFGCILHHRKLGYTANAMAVWDVPDRQVDAIATLFVRNPRVTLCYCRSRRPPAWRYNLYCMVHAKSRADASAVIGELTAAAGSHADSHAVLFSTRCFKQRGAVFSDRKRKVH
ncbi:MAG: Lrp/AsnC family transcriptional regulator [Pseudolabrys sp.]